MSSEPRDPLDLIEKILGLDLAEEVEVQQPVVAALLAQAGKLIEDITERFWKLRESLDAGLGDKLAKLRRSIKRVAEVPPGAAIDSTFPPDGGVELVGGHLIGIVAGYVLFGGAKRSVSIKPRSVSAKTLLVDNEEAKKNIPLVAKLLEKRVGLKLLRLGDRGELDIKLLLLDGEVVPYQLLFKSSNSISKKKLLRRLDEATARFLEEALDRGITVVGVVKRSYSHLSSLIAGSMLPFNDKALMSMLLSRGEYVVLGSFKDLLPSYAKLLSSLGQAPEKLVNIVEERLKTRRVYGDIIVAFYKPSIPAPYNQAVRIEVLPSPKGLGVDEVVAILDALTNPATGLPLPVDIIDEYTRFESRLLELVRRRLLAGLAQSLGPYASIILGHTNPEKRYLYELRRRPT